MTTNRRHPLSVLGHLGLLLALGTGYLGAAAPVAAADAPNTCGGATTTAPSNSWLGGTIATSTDVDWYRFSIGTGTRAIITLGDLPADYDLALYRDCSTLVATSTRSGRQFDEIYRSLSAGTYRVKVAGYRGAHSTQPYALRLRTLSWGIKVLSSTTWTDAAGYLHVTADNRGWIQVDASLLGAGGAVLARAVGYPKTPTLAPWSRSPFELVAKKPAGYATTSLAICTPTTTGG
jgi:hypothetical protein